MTSRRSFLRGSALLGAAALGTGCLDAGPPPEERVRSAAEAFTDLRDVGDAVADGYRTLGRHVRTDDGGLGEVFVNDRQPFAETPDDLDPERPTVLFYRLTGDGGYDPAGAGWSVPVESADGPPTLFGREFHGPSEHAVPGQSDHYGLHAWVFEDNPDGVFAPLHPELVGPAYVQTVYEVRAALDRFRPQVETDAEEVEGGAKAAEEAGYRNTEEQISSGEKLYGVPFYDPEIEGLDPERPPILLYRMTSLWYYELMGAEWYVPVEEVDEPPEPFGQRLHEPMAGHSPHTDQPEHYGLHAWLFRANPDGMFELFNPNPQLR
jgi:hypothetical protein